MGPVFFSKVTRVKSMSSVFNVVERTIATRIYWKFMRMEERVSF